MTTDIENRYPFTSIPRPTAQIRVGAYEQGELQIVIPCSSEREATGIGKALESQGYVVRIRSGATMPATLADESE
jgi:hypothetical protein